jgi:hypothetical protein
MSDTPESDATPSDCRLAAVEQGRGEASTEAHSQIVSTPLHVFSGRLQMLSMALIKLIETHAESLTREVVEDLLTNEHTPTLHGLSKAELEPRIFLLCHTLGDWLTGPNHQRIRAEYEDWGRTRHRQKVPLSEIVYSMILIKQHLRRYIREHGPAIFSGEPIRRGEVLPLELYSIQELNYAVGDFFDQALYYLTRGFEARAKEEEHTDSHDRAPRRRLATA